MLKKIFKIIAQHKIIVVIIALMVVGGGFFGYKKFKGNGKETRYVLAAVEKGTIVSSASGSGQVSVLNQLDITPKMAGEVKTIYVKKDQEVKTGQLLVELDSTDAQKSIRDAQVALDNAKANLADLLSQPDANSLLQAKNAVAQAERDLNTANENYEEIKVDAERSLADAYENGYSTVSTSFFKLSGYIKDLKDVLGTEQQEQEYVSSYRLILGSNSLFIQRLLDDYDQAESLFSKNFESFRTVFRDADRDTIYQLIGDTLKTTKAISQALESGRHLYDAIVVQDYKYLVVASYIDQMQSKVESDVAAIYSNINSLQQIKDTIDDTNKNTPKKIKEAELAIQLAQEKLDEKKLALQELMAGADRQEIESQRNTVSQKEDALLDAKEKLANCFIRAPFSGLIAEIDEKIKTGDTVSSGTVLLTLITKQKIAGITLNEIDITKVKTGQKATITFDAVEDLTITGEVIEVNTLGTVSQGVVTYDVKIALDTQDERVKPGMSVSAAIITDIKQNVLMVPNSAIKTTGNAYYVEIPENISSSTQTLASLSSSSGLILKNPPRQQTIETGLANDSSTEIISGLKEGDVIVVRTITPSSSTQNQSSSNRSFFQSVGTSRNTGQPPVGGMMIR